MDNFLDIFQHAGEYASILGHIIGAASVLASVIPGAQGASLVLVAARKALDLAACNFGNAANRK